MTRSGARAVYRVARSRLGRGESGDGGFILLESMIAITLITLLAAALGTFFVNGVASTNQQRARQFATQVAATAIESLRSIPASDLKTGRDQTSVTAQFAAAPAAVAPWIDPTLMSRTFWDDTAADGSGASAVVPTSATPVTINGNTFTVNRYLGSCAALSGNSADCTVANVGDPAAVTYIRAAVAVGWPDSRCPAGTCTYATGTVLTTSADATFNLNQIPFAPPVVVNPGSQTSMATDAISLPVAVQANTGVPTITWGAANLPAGLAIDPATGIIAGILTTAVTNLSVTVTARDGFVRSASATFTWTVTPQIAASALGTPTATEASAITPVTLTATGGTGTGYTWSDPTGTLPPGLTIGSSTGTISGTPTKAGTYPVQLTVTDSANHKAITTGTWTVGFAPLVPANPGPQTSTVNTAISPRQLTASGGSGTYLWAVTSGLPTGLTLSPAGVISGTPTTTTTATTVNATVTDPGTGTTRPLSFAWTVDAQPSVAAPASQTTSVGASVNLGFASTCPNTPCTYALTSGPSGLSVTAAGIITGIVGGAPQTYPAVKITVTDAAGASVASTAFQWTVKAAPSVTAPASQTTTVGASINLSLATTCPLSPCTYALANGPSGLSVTAAGVITGTVGAPAQTYPSSTVTVTDAAGSRVGSAAFQWTVFAAPSITTPNAQTTTVGGSVSRSLTTTCPNTPCTYALTGGPSGLSVTAAGVITGTVSGSAQTYPSVKVAVTDSSGVTATTAAFQWNVVSGPSVAAPGSQTTSVGASVNLGLASTCPNTPCTYALTGGPSGLSGTAAGVITGTVTGSAQTYAAVKVTVTDASGISATTAAFQWTVKAAPSVTAPASQTTTVGATINLSLATTCPYSPCTYSLSSGPSGLTVTGAGVITGTVGTPAQTYPSVKVTVTDAAGSSVTSAAFQWLVNAAPTMTNPGTQTVYVNTSDSLDLTTLRGGGTAPFTYSAAGLPAWLTLNSSTGLISGTAPAAKAVISPITVTVTDAVGRSATSGAFKWIVTDLRMPIPDVFTAPLAAGSLDLDNYVAGGTPGYTLAVSGSLPSWLSYNTTSHVISGTAPSAKSDSTITVTATDTQGAVVTTTFHWLVSTLQLTIGNQQSTAGATINVDVDNFITGTATSVTVTGRPAWLTYNSSSHVLGGTAPATGTVATGIVVTATDASGFAVSRTIRWNVSDLRWSGLPAGGWSNAHSGAVSRDMSTYRSGGTGPFTYTATGLPPGLAIDAGTGVVSGTTTATVATYTVTVTVTDSLGATATTATTNWKIT